MQSLMVRQLISSKLLNYNLTRQIFSQPKRNKPLYQLRIAHPSDREKLMQFMLETYMRSEPSLVNIGLGSGPLCPCLIHLTELQVAGGLTIIAEDREGCVAGAAVNVDSRPGQCEAAGRLLRACQCCSCRESSAARDLFDFYSFVSRQADPWRVYGLDRVFECSQVAVHPEHQGQGIARRLVEESWVLARDLAFRLFRIDCSSKYTANIAENFSWKCLYSIPYRRYFANGDFVFKCVQEPHTEFKVFVDPLNYYGGYYPPARRPAAK